MLGRRWERAPLAALVAAAACGGTARTEERVPPAAPLEADREPCALPDGGGGGAASWEDEGGRAEVAASGPPCTRRFTLRTTADLRGGVPESPRIVAERPDRPAARTGSVLFDALYALAIDEVHEASVSQIRDDAFHGGEPVACAAGGCFETGRLWTYVWTRDTAYAVDLGLAAIDPPRARASLEFKLSERRGGGDLQIVQDTGTGGSYPISTDRVAWALGAERLLHQLGGEERAGFARRVLEAVGNTIEHDRAVVFDEGEGLYRGETSFLDWREQTYPARTARHTAEVGSSRALSTNVDHLRAIELAAALAAEAGDQERAARWSGWARELRAALADRFTVPGTPLLSSFRPSELDPAPVRRFDLLGLALAIDAGVVDPRRAAAVVRAYPWLPAGPPVVWPQDPAVPIYHNRAVWPFVTAYWLRAAARVGDDQAITDGVLSLVRGAALNLSHMENFEAVTGRPHLEEGERSGPVVNSQRQLWSVAGYLAMVHEVIFGLRTTADGLRVRPMVTRELRRRLFGGATSLVLDRYPYQGRRLTVVLELPAPGRQRDGVYRVGRIRLDGRAVDAGGAGDAGGEGAGALVPAAALADGATLAIELVEGEAARRTGRAAAAERAGRAAAPASGGAARRAPGREELFAPPPPALRAVEAARGRLRLRLVPPEGGGDPAGLALRVYRDGALVEPELAADARSWIDPDARAGGQVVCYAVEAFYRSSGNTSHRTAPRCWFGRRGALLRRARPGQGGAFPLGRAAGAVTLRARYRNPGPLNTGVTCAVRRIDLLDAATGQVLASDYLLLPHTGEATATGVSEWVTLAVPGPARPLAARLEIDERAVNMSVFAHFERYTGGRGGADGARNEAAVQALEAFSRPAASDAAPARSAAAGAAR